MPSPSKGSARIDLAGVVTQLGSRAVPDEVVTEADVVDAVKLAKTIARILSTLAMLRRQWVPRTIDFEVAAPGGAATFTLAHGFNGRVRWWVVGWQATSGSPTLRENTTLTDANTLALFSGTAGTVIVRVQEAG